MTPKLELKNNGNGKEYKVKVICDKTVYTNTNKSEGYLPYLYYLVL